MRLDHLLSKEHLTPKGVQEPTVDERSTGVLRGGDTGQSEPATVLRVSTAAVPFGCRRQGSVGGCGWGGRTDMHPVGYLKEQPLCGVDAAVGLRCQA